jgi:hypothetical protein
MPTYLIEGKKVKADKPLTDAEIDEIASGLKAAPAPTAEAPMAEIPAPRRMPSLSDVGDRATGFRAQVEATGMTPEERTEAVRTGAAFAGGVALGPVLGGIVRSAATAVPAIQRFAAPVATALESGGFRTGLPATATTAQRVALRTGAGAVTGGGAAALVSPEDAGTGAAVGAALPVIAAPVAKVLAKGAGAVVDSLAGRTADARANELIRTAANNEVNALRQAMAANPDVPASRAAADLNLPVLQALLQRAEQRDPKQVVNAFRQRESQDIVNQLTRIAGGPTAETARTARESAKASLTGVTGPMREDAFAAARKTGEVMPKLQTIADDARAEVTKNVDVVRRVSNLVDRADDWARNWITGSRLVEGPGGKFTREYVTDQGVGEAGTRLASQAQQRYTFPGQLAASGRQTTVGGPFERQVIDEGGAIAGRIERAAEESRKAGARGRAAEATLESMKARGIEPISAPKLTGSLNSLLRNPEVATNREAATAIPRVVDMVNDWTNEFGVVTPEALYAIRKNAVAGVIRELNPNMDAKAQERFAARVLTEIKPLFDDAIERAGGKGFRDYLKSVEGGMSSIKGMELADQIRQLYAKGTPESKRQIIDLVRGESPDVVEDLFGSGRYKISKEMAKDMPFLTQLADTLDLDAKAVQQAAAGRAALTEAEKKGSVRVRFPFFTRASTAVNEIVAGLEQRMKAETLDVLIRAAQSGREFNRVLNQLPAKDRNEFLAQFKNAESWNKFSGQVAQASQAQVSAEPRNRMAPENRNALAR